MTEMLYKRDPALDRAALFEELRCAILDCKTCGLCEKRTHVVPGEGDITSPLIFVGEGPGEVEDREGRPFVGPAGQLLTKILAAAGFSREEVYITNIVKCRPPGNRLPQIDEVINCQRWLEAQISLIRPKLIVALGNTPLKWFLHCAEGITKVRGRWYQWHGAELMPMFHPSYLLRNQSRERGGPKDLTWRDIREVRARYEALRNR